MRERKILYKDSDEKIFVENAWEKQWGFQEVPSEAENQAGGEVDDDTFAGYHCGEVDDDDDDEYFAGYRGGDDND